MVTRQAINTNSLYQLARFLLAKHNTNGTSGIPDALTPRSTNMDHHDNQDSNESDAIPPETDDQHESHQDDDIEPPSKAGHRPASIPDLIRNLPLSKTEKITLASLAAILLALLLGGIIWLASQEKNHSTNADLPAKGQYTTITELDTIWITPSKEIKVNIDAFIVPSATITLDPNAKGKAALRLYVENAAQEIIGDPMTAPVHDGKFTNGTNRLEVVFTDGFHAEGQFFAYLEDDTKPWRLIILEAPDESSPRSAFKTLIDTPLSTKRR